MNRIEKFHKCCRNVVENSDQKSLNYAVNYAKAGLRMFDEYECRVQALYILGNMTHWRGDLAKITRSGLKEIAKL